MPQTCVVCGCRNTSSKEKAKTFSLHKYPQDRELRQKWDEFVRKTHPDFITGNQRTVVCSDHFSEDDFKNRGIFGAGFAEKLLLKKGAIPSVAERQGDIQVGTPTMQSCPSGNITAPAVSSETSAVNLDDGLYQDKNIHMEASGPTQVDKAGTPPTEGELLENIKLSADHFIVIDNTTGDIVCEDQALNTSSCSSTQETSHSPYNAPSPIAVAGSANDFVLGKYNSDRHLMDRENEDTEGMLGQHPHETGTNLPRICKDLRTRAVHHLPEKEKLEPTGAESMEDSQSTVSVKERNDSRMSVKENDSLKERRLLEARASDNYNSESEDEADSDEEEVMPAKLGVGLRDRFRLLRLQRKRGGVDTEYPLTGTVPVEDTQNDHSLGSEDEVPETQLSSTLTEGAAVDSYVIPIGPEDHRGLCAQPHQRTVRLFPERLPSGIVLRRLRLRLTRWQNGRRLQETTAQQLECVDNACMEAAHQPSTSQASSRSQTPQPYALPKRKKRRTEHPQVTSAAAAGIQTEEDRNRQLCQIEIDIAGDPYWRTQVESAELGHEDDRVKADTVNTCMTETDGLQVKQEPVSATQGVLGYDVSVDSETKPPLNIKQEPDV